MSRWSLGSAHISESPIPEIVSPSPTAPASVSYLSLRFARKGATCLFLPFLAAVAFFLKPSLFAQQVFLQLQKTDTLNGRWSDVFMSPEMVTNGRIATGPVAGNSGFWRMNLEMASNPAINTSGPNISVPREASTLQAAVDLLPNGGTVYVSTGVYTNPVTISGKNVNFVGISSDAKPIIQGPAISGYTSFTNALGIINYGPNASGAVMNLVIVGGDTGIRGFTSSDPRDLPPNVTLSNVTLTRNVRGVAGSFSQLTVSASSILKASMHGISVSNGNSASLEFANSILGQAGGYGLRVISGRPSNNPLTVFITNSTFVGNAGAGAVMIGPISVQAFSSHFIANGQAGLWCNGLATTNNRFWNCVAAYNTNNPYVGGSGNLGIGLALAQSGVINATLSEFLGNERAGLVAESAPAGFLLAGSTVTANLHGVITAGGASLNQIWPNVITNNSGENIMSDSTQSVPGPPPIPE